MLRVCGAAGCCIRVLSLCQ